jgi:tetraacyldisaccharide 4'-kinase
MVELRLERRWESTTLASRALRFALAPLSWLYGRVVAVRNWMYDASVLRSHALGLPTISIGNLTVGGTGKTPMASWFASQIAAAGGVPAILLRGYGGDEVKVHNLLTPNAIVVAGADRRRSAETARNRGATAIVLDDGFQHRKVKRDADVVIISADRHRQTRLLPAGPWREPFISLRRATHIIVTRKRTTPLHAREVLGYATRMAPNAEAAIVHLAADRVVRWDGAGSEPLSVLAGQTVLAICGIGDPRSFEAQLRELGSRVALRSHRDHHAYTAAETEAYASDARGADYVVCTLKDAVKLAPFWPSTAPPLWYLSQRVSIELGAESLEGLARRLARPADR